MLEREDIYKRVIEIANGFLEDDFVLDDDENRILHIILSESSQALEFVCSLEDEFEMEFDDDEIDLDFFSDFGRVTDCVMKHIDVSY